MLLSVQWLRDYLQKTDVKIDPKELAEDLTMRGIPVASVRNASTGLQNVFVGRIEKIDKHPNADRLQVTQVVFSSEPGAETHQIVCGAKNIAVGDIVPVARPGAILPGDFTIKISTIRGVESHGMICSAKELGIADESEGILQLPKHAHLGELVGKLLGQSVSEDTILELELTANRGDCLSMLGLAREIAPLLKTKLREPKPPRFKAGAHRTSSIIKVEVEDNNACPRYIACALDSLKVEESPDWIKQRLESVGLKPINNIVDITNFVMLEYGQPLHAFDLRKIQSGTIKVAPCKTSMDFTLLNGQTVLLEPGDILILDGDRPIALAGIMGGANSQIMPDTTSIVLESAAFDAIQIRKTAKRLGLKSDASKRFEKSVDIAAVSAASERAAALLRDSFNANVYYPSIDTNESGIKENQIALDMRDVKRLSGLKDLSAEKVAELLDTIGIPSQKKSANVLTIRLPTFRQDLKESVDIIEEILRLHGYERIPTSYFFTEAAFHKLQEQNYRHSFKLRHYLTSFGLREVVQYSFVSPEFLQKLGFSVDNLATLVNPISEEMKVMRPSLLPSLLSTYQYNRNRNNHDLKIFEIGRVYTPDSASETKVHETDTLAGLITGASLAKGWRQGKENADYFYGKGVIEKVLEHFYGIKVKYEPLKDSRIFHPNRSVSLTHQGKFFGKLGEAHPFLKNSVLDTQDTIVLFEIDLDALKKSLQQVVQSKEISKFPGSQFDLAFVVPKTVAYEEIISTLRKQGGNQLKEASLFDVYEGSNIAEDKRSLAIRISLSLMDRTLQDAEIDKIRNQMIDAVTSEHHASLR